MKQHLKTLYIILLTVSVCTNQAEDMLNITQPYTIQEAQKPPMVAFFRSLYAKKEISSGKFPIKAVFEGFIYHAPFWDSRQVDGAADNFILFAPQPKRIGTGGGDINSVGEFSMTVIETLLRVNLFGPKVLGAESFGLIETDFIGAGDIRNRLQLTPADFITRFRDRLAYLKLTWKKQKVTFLAGQYYHPLRLSHLDLEAKVISKNIGSPIHPDSRNPQIRITKAWPSQLNMVFTALAELNGLSKGPEGASSIYLRRSMQPIMDIEFWFGPENTNYVFGVGFDVKRLVPRLVTSACVKTDTSITSVAFTAFSKITAKPLTVRTQFIWSQNGTDYGLLGGYAVSSIEPITDIRHYANIRVLSYWLDLNIDKKISPGLFGGYSKNLGTNTPIIPSITDPTTGITESLVYGNGPNIKYMARLAPRVRFHFRPYVLGAELEWTRAAYGTLSSCGQIKNIEPVSNVRLIFASFFFF